MALTGPTLASRLRPRRGVAGLRRYVPGMAWCRRHLAALLGVGFAAATAVILAGNISRSFDYDEGVAIASTISRGSATAPLTDSTVFNNHPLFSVGQSVWWAIGGEGEARQRVLPVLYGAAAVAILVWWVARRVSTAAGFAAGLVLMLNPMFVTESRDVRGYSLATLAVVVGVVSLIDYVRAENERPGSGSVRLLAVHTVAIVVGMGTHLYAGVALGAVGVGSLFMIRRIDLRLFAAWVVAGIGTAAVYLPTFDELRSTTDARGSTFWPWFGRFTTWEVLGRDRLTAFEAVFGEEIGGALGDHRVAHLERDCVAGGERGDRHGSGLDARTVETLGDVVLLRAGRVGDSSTCGEDLVCPCIADEGFEGLEIPSVDRLDARAQ